MKIRVIFILKNLFFYSKGIDKLFTQCYNTDRCEDLKQVVYIGILQRAVVWCETEDGMYMNTFSEHASRKF